ncbi:hypothetical protein NDU88_001570 [Pleurodeles waltl]|uniref:Uncharacterized protein n=1 Tax=Pleurodeles waltl TaxID=8319 RepID=A0AAV7TKI0_PLEWA|nr:hypothetical protein NDU88_001570 [Pleurodeles waltl]
MLVECSSCSPVFIAIPPITGRSVAWVFHLRPATPLLVVGGPRLHTPSRTLSRPRSPSRIGWRVLRGSCRLQVCGVSAPAVCSVPRCPGVYSTLDFRTAGLRAPSRYVHAAAPRLPLIMAVGVAAPPQLQFEVSCCRDRISELESFVISAMRDRFPHAAAILVFWSSGARSYFLLSCLVGGVATAPGSAQGSADVEIAFD